MSNPFKAMSERHPKDARLLAHIIVTSCSWDEVYACSRFERRTNLDSFRELSAYLDGSYFQNIHQWRLPEDALDLDELKEQASEFLSESHRVINEADEPAEAGL